MNTITKLKRNTLLLVLYLLLLYYIIISTISQILQCLRKTCLAASTDKKGYVNRFKNGFGERGESRTLDTVIKSRVLCQLSYSFRKWSLVDQLHIFSVYGFQFFCYLVPVAEGVGFEPTEARHLASFQDWCNRPTLPPFYRSRCDPLYELSAS